MTSVVDRAQASLAPRVVARKNYRRTMLSIIVVLAAIGILITVFGNERFGWPVIATYLFHPSIIAGIGNTLLLTLVCMVIGTLMGGVLALMRLSPSPPLQWIASVYTWFFRGVPLLVLLLFWFNLSALFPNLGIGLPGMEPWITLNANEIISPFTAAVLALSLHESAYMAEIIRSGLSAVDRGQREAAQALGMKPSKVDSRIIIPQAMRIIVPPTANQVISMLKSTSLVSVIALSDLLYSAQIIYSSNYQVIPLLVVATIWYLFLVSLLTLVQSRVEKIFNRGYAARSQAKKRPSTPEQSEEPTLV
ncbi:MAG: amino acid ABC transporter permease [Homoserinimonas sp.]